MLRRGAQFACAVKESAAKAAYPGAIVGGYSSSLLFSSSPAVDDDSSLSSLETEAPKVTVTQQKQFHAGQEEVGGGARRKRHRHRFNNFTDEIPSFQEFQQQQQIRSLYRKFTRLVFQKAASTRIDLQRQIRHEFRLPQSDALHVKRSMSEGNRRYKELTAMLGSAVVSDPNKNNSLNSKDNESALPKDDSVPASATGNWPWNRPSSNSGDANGTPPRPLPFPRKSNL